MDQLNEQQLQLHVPIVAWLLIVGHAIFLAIAGFVLLLLTSIGVTVHDAQASGILFVVATGVASLLGLIAIPGLIAGFGLLARQSWARILAIVVAILGLLNFPLGTLIGLYSLWVLLQEAGTTYFAGQNTRFQTAPKAVS
jgi:hypothetical protein